MHVGQIIETDCANGAGVRLSVFVSGCTNHCKGCFQPQTWDFDFGEEYTPETEEYILNELKKPYYDGITILGGEPFEPCNQAEIVKLIRRVREETSDKNIWMFSGFTYDKDLAPGGCRYTPVTDEILSSIDVLVDGRFVEEERDMRLRFKGSRNQRVIDVKASRTAGTVVLSKYN